MAENESNGTSVAPSAEERQNTIAEAKEVAAAKVAEATRLAESDDMGEQPAAKKPKIAEEQTEEKDFDKETQKALEEIDANQNEIDALNERK